MVSNGLTTSFQLRRHWLARFSDVPKLSGQPPSYPQRPRHREAHWFGATITVVLLVFRSVFGSMCDAVRRAITEAVQRAGGASTSGFHSIIDESIEAIIAEGRVARSSAPLRSAPNEENA